MNAKASFVLGLLLSMQILLATTSAASSMMDDNAESSAMVENSRIRGVRKHHGGRKGRFRGGRGPGQSSKKKRNYGSYSFGNSVDTTTTTTTTNGQGGSAQPSQELDHVDSSDSSDTNTALTESLEQNTSPINTQSSSKGLGTDARFALKVGGFSALVLALLLSIWFVCRAKKNNKRYNEMIEESMACVEKTRRASNDDDEENNRALVLVEPEDGEYKAKYQRNNGTLAESTLNLKFHKLSSGAGWKLSGSGEDSSIGPFAILDGGVVSRSGVAHWNMQEHEGFCGCFCQTNKMFAFGTFDFGSGSFSGDWVSNCAGAGAARGPYESFEKTDDLNQLLRGGDAASVAPTEADELSIVADDDNAAR